MKYDFIICGCNSPEVWVKSGFFNRSGHFLKLLDADDRAASVLYLYMCESRPSLKNSYPLSRSGALGAKTKFIEFSPLFGERSRCFRNAGNCYINSQVRGFRRRGEKTIYLFFTPAGIRYAGGFGEDLSVFDAFDNWLEIPEWQDKRSALESYYGDIKKEAGLITVNTEYMKEFLETGRDNVFLIPNGWDAGIFSPGRALAAPPEFKNIPRPVCGYAGSVHSRFDLELLEYLAEHNRQASFAVAGKIWNDTREKFLKTVSANPNIYYLGEKPYGELPSYIAAFDLALILHRENELSKSMDPIKIYEYTSMKKNIIATASGKFPPFANIILASGYRAFAAAVNKYLKEPFLGGGDMNAYSWEKRLEALFDLIREKTGAAL